MLVRKRLRALFDLLRRLNLLLARQHRNLTHLHQVHADRIVRRIKAADLIATLGRGFADGSLGDYFGFARRLGLTVTSGLGRNTARLRRLLRTVFHRGCPWGELGRAEQQTEMHR